MVTFLENMSLAGRNTFGVDALAPFWAEFTDVDSLREILIEARRIAVPWYVLGGGSNVLLTGNFPGVVIHPSGGDINIVDSSHDGSVTVRVDAGVVWDDFVAWAAERGLGGVENLSLIPGQVGASPVQNIGAYGAEAKDTITSVEYMDAETLELCRLSGAECRFGYRDSIFKGELRGCAIVTAVEFALRTTPIYNIRYGELFDRVQQYGGTDVIAPIEALGNIRRAVIDIRRAKLPDPERVGNAGSFFKNPLITAAHATRLRVLYPDMPSYVLGCEPSAASSPLAQLPMEKIPAGWLIDKAGWKGYRSGTVGVHASQALVLVNHGGATACEVLNLARRVIDDIKARFDIEISMEVNVL